MVTDVIQPHAIQNGKTLSINMPSTNPEVRGDADALVRLMMNLLHNAISYGGKNIIISANQTDDAVLLTVEDDGAGIAPELLDKVFDKGVSGFNSTGLGLHICQEIAQAHKGDITVKNKESGGACFTLKLPVGALRATPL